MKNLWSTLVLVALGLTSCKSGRNTSNNASNAPLRVVETQEGIASLYTDRRTASGERFSSRAMTAAHRTWPMGTLVRCTHLDNGRSVIVRINDRGPFRRGRVIDLTPAAATAIGLTRTHGLCRIRVERLQ